MEVAMVMAAVSRSKGRKNVLEIFVCAVNQNEMDHILLWPALRITALPTLALAWFTMVILRLKCSLALWQLTRTQHLNIARVF